MQAHRKVAYAPRTKALALETSQMIGPCVGCVGCRGICQALLDAMTLPEIVLRDRSA